MEVTITRPTNYNSNSVVSPEALTRVIERRLQDGEHDGVGLGKIEVYIRMLFMVRTSVATLVLT